MHFEGMEELIDFQKQSLVLQFSLFQKLLTYGSYVKNGKGNISVDEEAIILDYFGEQDEEIVQKREVYGIVPGIGSFSFFLAKKKKEVGVSFGWFPEGTANPNFNWVTSFQNDANQRVEYTSFLAKATAPIDPFSIHKTVFEKDGFTNLMDAFSIDFEEGMEPMRDKLYQVILQYGLSFLETIGTTQLKDESKLSLGY